MSETENILKYAFIWHPMRMERAADLRRCRAAVHDDFGVGHHQCTRRGKIERGGYLFCATHDPVTIKAKRDARNAAWAAEAAERDKLQKFATDRQAFKAACEAAIRLIASGHNDPRLLALETLARDPDVIKPSEAA